ncbi:MAG: DUF1289 domain-containing protein [Alphaproteobacteria bacterium]|nr:DUF1289 domain-containing protein [Alphaproteobacteria bacterium]
MADSASSSSPYPTTPCVAVCQIDPEHGFCLGCYRTLKEIARWGKITESERQALLPELDRRREEDKRRLEAKREAKDDAGR